MVNIIGADRFNEHQQYESGYFTLKLIKAATQNFNPANRICHWKRLYKGVLPDGMKITVKQLDEREDYVFKNEVKFLSTLRHPNIVRLLGQCTENKQRLLVYEYMENGSLSNALSGGNENLRKRLNWHTKMRICLGIANGLAFLHHKDDSKAIIVHRDIQHRSIFLDKFLDPKISYFGLTKHFGADGTHCTTSVGGAYAIGYDAPEYLTRGLITEKADVFSFGVSILVLSTEKKSFDLKRLANDEDLLLVDLAKDLHQKGGLLSLIDEDLASSNSVKEATMLLELAMLCTNESPELRPSMSEVVSILEGNTTTKTPPVDPLYMTTISYEEVMSEIESARSSSSHTKLKRDGFLYNPNDEWDGKGGDGTLPYQVASKVKEDNTLPEVHNDVVSDLKAFLSEGGEENDKVEYAIPSVETHEPYETATFSLRYIEVATRNFSPANKIGQGSSGSVYKGMVPNGRMIAVKQLSLESDQGKVEFLNEVNTISTLSHPNIIRLLGHCAENDQHLLVYEYMENGCLNKVLFDSVNLKNKLSWPARLRICTGIAKGLAYLHSDNSKVKIVHRDIKLSNILLDKDLNPRISDFGLIMHYNREISHIKTGLAGTVGYMAPEYVMHGTLTEKIAVYSFGIVTLELMTGKNRIQWKTKHESISLLDLACDLQKKGDLLGLFDQDVRMNIPVGEAKMVLNLAVLCASYDPKSRPAMSDVVDILEGTLTWVKTLLCNSNDTTRMGSTKNIDDISSHNSSSTAMHYGKDVSSNDVFDCNDGVATGTSSNGVSEVDEFEKDNGFHGDLISNVNVSVGEVWKSDMPLTQVTITSAEPMGLNVKPQASSISKYTYNQKGVHSKLEFSEPSFEEGKLHIEFSADEFRAVCDEWENCLVGFFVGEDVPFNMDLKFVKNIWEVKGDFSVFTIENGYFVFQFSCVEEKMRVLESADLWRIRQRQLILKEWDWKLMVSERIGMESLPIWVKIYNLPLFFWTPAVLSKVGSGLGTPLYALYRI
ncbi:uncharacterized protein LOC113277607 isoform X1 [Papaver somniferum]|uniref:uncharacterized protein LOC113277607 isoform X1 n=2 Tax=Papaver somniferum TaxID=3469 RepID=UPI000E70118D|nr:uncharacterized protein LOC113277607 isoform X1 [Papaver somniferum]XP_026382448.1 uncharacterized protein LOC113277607 isoform X1 [Papaver somniferum]XP_026382454.1 uncharacterized protein LOC113277607 isoform X1 [Papaver somniferum]XP_026382461.1 uncharacterized protein LOC113277607 isoform X1 [Papaver somniferum]